MSDPRSKPVNAKPGDRSEAVKRFLSLLRESGGALSRSEVARQLRPRHKAPELDRLADTMISAGLITREADTFERRGAKVVQTYTRMLYRLTDRGFREAPPAEPRAVPVSPNANADPGRRPRFVNPIVASRVQARGGRHSTANLANRRLTDLIETLRAERERQGLSRATISQMSGVTEIALEHLGGGRTGNPKWETIARYAEAVELVVTWGRKADGPDEGEDGRGEGRSD